MIKERRPKGVGFVCSCCILLFCSNVALYNFRMVKCTNFDLATHFNDDVESYEHQWVFGIPPQQRQFTL